MSRLALAALLAATVALGAGSALGARPSEAGSVTLAMPSPVEGGTTVAFEFRLPPNIAAVDGRLFLDTAAAEIVGLAPLGGGSALEPLEIPGGYAFGAYGLSSRGGRTVMRVALLPAVPGDLSIRVVIDATADRDGNRVDMRVAKAIGSLRVGGGARRLGAPRDVARWLPLRAAGPLRDVVRDGAIGPMDFDVVRTAWERARVNDTACGMGAIVDGDANGDGCIDIVDVQAVAAAHGRRLGSTEVTDPARATVGNIDTRLTASVAGSDSSTLRTLQAPGLTFVVTSTADTTDATNGDGLCADSQGRCTLRAAITESNWQRGENRIEFNLAGSAPVAIQLNGNLPAPLIQDRSGGVVIDGFSQPGSRVSNATHGSNAIPGVEIRGSASSPRSNAFRITSAGNTIRGLVLNNHYRPIVMDGVDAFANRIIGNHIGFTASGAVHSYRGNHGVRLNNGANNNIVGTSALADRNVIGPYSHPIDLYGPGTDHNVIQNNLLCITPSGTSHADCSTAIDLNFGPKHNLYGGTEPGQRNVIGRSRLNGIEISHGWDPDKRDNSTKWQNNHNRVIGNWVGFRADGSYDAAFRSGQNSPNSNDANGINVYDGSNHNLVEGNWVASVHDGINTMSPNTTGTIIRNNIIGESPRGQAAPMARHGIHVRNNTKTHVIEGNTIRNAGVYGIGLTQKDVLWVRMSRNIITDMAGTAIYLAPDGNSTSVGANNLLAAPVITSATTVRVNGTGIAGATVEVYRASRAAGQRGLPIAYLGSGVVGANGAWNVLVTLQTGDRVTALQIHTSGNTSSLAANVSAGFEPAPAAPIADVSWTQRAGSLTVDFNDTSTGGAPSQWSWDFGDGSSSSDRNPVKAYASAGQYTVVLTASNGGGSSAATRQVTVQAPAPPPPGGTTVAADAFGRTLNGSWGSADIGGSYTLQGTAANYAVAAGAGTMQLPAAGTARSALLNGVSQRDVDMRFRVAVNKPATGANYFVYAVARRNSKNEYRPRVIFNSNGSVAVNASVLVGGSESALGSPVVVSGLTQTGSFIWVRAQVTGASPTTVRIKAWADGQSEPAAWQFTATSSHAAVQVAGAVGLRTYIGAKASNAPVTFSFDDYSVAGMP